MNIVRELHKVRSKLEHRLAKVNQAIHALDGGMPKGRKPHALKGRKLSKSHIKAIKAGWAKRRAAKK